MRILDNWFKMFDGCLTFSMVEESYYIQDFKSSQSNPANIENPVTQYNIVFT